MKHKTYFLLFIFFSSFFSCTGDLDFDQIDDFSSEPVVKSTLTYFTLTQNHFFDSVNFVEVATIEELTEFTLFENSFFRKNLVSAELDISIENHFNRDFTIDIEFLDDNNNVLYSLSTLTINANDQNYTYQETIQIANNQPFLSSTQVRVTVQMQPSSNGSTIDPVIDQQFIFKSFGTFYLKT